MGWLQNDFAADQSRHPLAVNLPPTATVLPCAAAWTGVELLRVSVPTPTHFLSALADTAHCMQQVPVKLYRSADRVTVAAPMPGLLAEDFTIEVTADGRLVLNGALRGIPADIQLFHHPAPGQPGLVTEMREMLLDEWIVGSYQRELELPNPVNGRRATATYGNGVLVVTLPIAKRVVATRFHLTRVGEARGEHVGSLGHPVKATSTRQHLSAAHHSSP